MKKFDFCEIYLRKDGILQINISPNSDILVNHIKIMVTTAIEICNGKSTPLIMFIGEFSTFSKEAREFSANRENLGVITSIAYVLNNLGQRLIINFFIKVNKPTMPIKMFGHEKDAILWLKKLT